MPSLIAIFQEVSDPRDENAQHDLGALLFLALAATLCGAKSCVQIAEFSQAREAELRELVDLSHGVPSHDTFSRVFRLLDPKELERAFGACSRPLPRFDAGQAADGQAQPLEHREPPTLDARRPVR